MTKEQLLQMAREAGFSVKNFKPPVITAQHSNGSWVSVGDELEAFATLVRNAALEEAAKQCDIGRQKDSSYWDMECAILNMKEPT